MSVRRSALSRSTCPPAPPVSLSASRSRVRSSEELGVPTASRRVRRYNVRSSPSRLFIHTPPWEANTLVYRSSHYPSNLRSRRLHVWAPVLPRWCLRLEEARLPTMGTQRQARDVSSAPAPRLSAGRGQHRAKTVPPLC